MNVEMSYAGHTRAVLSLGLPLVGSFIAQMALTLTDAIMLGWYSVEALAAQVLGGMMFFLLFIVGSGFAKAVMPMVARAAANDDDVLVRRSTRMGMWVSFGFAVLVLPIMLFSERILTGLGQAPNLSMVASHYLMVLCWGMIPALLVQVLASFLSALERTKIILWVTLLTVGFNIALNYAFIFGHWGAPELGVRGAAVASMSVNVASFVLLAAYVARVTPQFAIFKHIWRPDWEAFGAVFRLGWPIGITSLSEAGLFAAASVMMGWIGTVALAAHGIALQVVSLMFMMQLGLSSVATVRVGRAVGRGDMVGLRRGAIVVLAVSLVMAILSIVIIVAIPETLVQIFLSPQEPERAAVVALGVGLLMAGAVFQLVDSAQVMALGLLRGLEDTRVPMIIAAVSYWIIGMPVSYFLGFKMDMGGVGIWLGLAVGLAFAGVFMMARFWGWSIHNIDAKAR